MPAHYFGFMVPMLKMPHVIASLWAVSKRNNSSGHAYVIKRLIGESPMPEMGITPAHDISADDYASGMAAGAEPARQYRFIRCRRLAIVVDIRYASL